MVFSLGGPGSIPCQYVTFMVGKVTMEQVFIRVIWFASVFSPVLRHTAVELRPLPS